MNSLSKKVRTILLTLCLNTCCFGQQNVTQIIEQSIKDNNIPGLAYVIAKNGKIVEEGYHGLSNLELNMRVNEKSVFAIASMSKTYTAAAILLLAEKEQLRLDDLIKKYIPEAPDTWSEITIKHLLTHSSGLVDDWGLYSWDKSNKLFLDSQSDSLILKNLFATELQFRPGTEVRYSCGPFVLGVVIERITGHYYEKYLKMNIFTPLGLNETYIDHPYKIIPNRVSGYFNHDTTDMNTRVSGIGNGILLAPVSYGRADVGIRTTARDLMKFYNALLTGKLLNEQSMKMMFNPSTLDNDAYISTAPGWMNWPLAGNMISEHSGGFRTGFSSQGLIVPKENFIVILLTNLHGASSFALTQKIAAIYNPQFSQLSKRTPQVDHRPKLTAQHLELFKSLVFDTINKKVVNERFPKSYYSKGLKKSISSTESIVFLGQDNVVERNIELFGERIFALRYYKLISSRELFTTVSLDKKGKVVFIDHPETE